MPHTPIFQNDCESAGCVIHVYLNSKFISDSGLREAKMKVLEQIQKVMVRDIQKFVDWLKTVRVEYNAGGML